MAETWDWAPREVGGWMVTAKNPPNEPRFFIIKIQGTGATPADARLIAAAPEMLEALHDIAAAYTWTAEQLRERAVAALARVDGGGK